jgi:hypothetical protein
MEIIFSGHANLKIRQRKLSRQRILATVVHPDFRNLGYSGREELFKDFGKNYMKVVITQERGAIVVVTAHWVVKKPKK